NTTRWPLHTGNIYPSAYFTRRQCMCGTNPSHQRRSSAASATHSDGMQGDYVLAVDGGNTKTIALVAALDGTILGAGRGGCADIYNAEAGTEWPDSAAAAMANGEYAVV